jgi:hypothetical protein
MSTLAARRFTLQDSLFRRSQSTIVPPSHRTRRRRRKLSPSRVPARPMIEWLEDYVLLSATIAGTVQLDQSGTGVLSPSNAGVAGESVYLDLNNDHQDQDVTTLTGPAAVVPLSSSSPVNFLNPALVSSIQVQGLQSNITDLTLSMDVTSTVPYQITVVLVSPVAKMNFDFPSVFQLNPGQTFNGTFADNALTGIAEATGSNITGTYTPEQFFNEPFSYIDGTNPNGDWDLVFIGAQAGQISLQSWSMTVTTPDPIAVTDGSGNYSFTGLAPGTYQVGVVPAPGDVQTIPTADADQTVTVTNGQNATGVDFGIQPASNLTTSSFYLSSPATSWGQDITINYTITNEGYGNAPAFDVGVLLSDDGTIAASDPSLETLHFDGLAAQSSTTGQVTVALPSTPPAGFSSTDQTIVGFLIDPNHQLTHNDAADDANQGFGTDEAALAITPNQAVTTTAGTQQDPSIAVDPSNPDHIVVAYMDYSLVNTGYAGIGVAVSEDDGATWTYTSVPLPSEFNQGAAQPTVQFDGHGNVFIAFEAATFLGPQKPDETFPSNTQAADGFESNNGIFVSESTDGGFTWGQPVTVVSHTFAGTPGTLGTTGPSGTEDLFEMDPDFAIDTYKTLPSGQPNPYYDDLYLTWVRLYPVGQYPGDPSSTDGSDIMFAVSSDGGQSWQTQLQSVPASGEPGNVQATVIQEQYETQVKGKTGDHGIAGQGFMFYPQVSIGPQGDIYVSAYDGAYFTVYHSVDDGASFAQPSFYTDLSVFPYQDGNVAPSATLAAGGVGDDAFRTLPVQDIVADPTHPGWVYIVALESFNVVYYNNTGLTEDDLPPEVVFAYSHDYGQTWQFMFQVGSDTSNLADLPPGDDTTFMSVLNDDDNGDDTDFDTAQQLAQEVVAGQALPSLAVDAQGQITVVWYDTRTDPLNDNLAVFGTESNDGGQDFSANFDLSDSSFNPLSGAFTDANGTTADYLGDRIGLTAVGGTGYAVWTTVVNGSQEIEFQQYSLNQPQAAPLDRFYPDNTPTMATALGTVTTQDLIPQLIAGPGDDNWYSLQAGASGALDIVATATSGNASSLQVELTDASGNVLPAVVTPVLNSSGAVIGSQLVFNSDGGDTYLVHVSDGTALTGYSLTLQSLTGDLGTSVEGSEAGTVTAGGQDLYRIEAAVSGSLSVTLNPSEDVSGDLVVNILSSNGQTVLMSGTSGGTPAGVPQTVSLPVTQGEVLLIQVVGNAATDNGDFTFTYTNFDQYETPGTSALFLPTTGDPTSVRVADLSGSSEPDILVTNVGTSDTLQVLAGNANGTFQAPQEYAVGPGLSTTYLNAGYRQIGVADFTDNGELDVAVPNYREADVSVLLNNGDGGFQPQRTDDAVTNPDSLVTGNFVAGSNNVDMAVLENYPEGNGTSQLGILIGRGDGTFEPAVLYPTVFTEGAGPMVVGDFTGNGIDDIIVFSKNSDQAEIFLGNGNGTFQPGTLFTVGENTYAAEAVDLEGNGILDLITTGTNSGYVYVQMGNGNGTFGTPTYYPVMARTAGADVGVYGLAVVGFNSTIFGSTPPVSQAEIAGTPGIYATAESSSGGTGAVFFLPAEFNAQGQFTGFGASQLLTTLQVAGKITAFDDNGNTEVVATDAGGVWLISGVSEVQTTSSGTSSLPALANTTLATARDLGSADHIVTDQETIVPGFEDAYFTYQVPVEAVPGSGPEVIDFSALFQDVVGAGLNMEVLNASGDLLGSGDRLRIIAAQGSLLTIHIFGEPAQAGVVQGAGVYTLDIDVLPQVVAVQAGSPIPGGPVTSIVVTLQGDDLDPTEAENPSNYTVICYGPGGGVIPLGSADGGPSVVYDPATDVDITGGLNYATAQDQTITLLFAQPLPPGSYEIELSPAIVSAPYSAAELSILAPGNGSFAGHPVVSIADASVVNGVQFFAPNLVATPVVSKTPGSAVGASQFLTSLQGNLAALIDQGLEASVADTAITAELNNLILSQYAPLYGSSGSSQGSIPSFAIIWFDPVSIGLQSPQGLNLSYELSSNALTNSLGSTFVSVGSNVEMIVMENAAGTFNLDVGNVASTAQGGAVLLSASGFSEDAFTAALQAGATAFALALGGETGGTTSSSAPGETTTGPTASSGSVATSTSPTTTSESSTSANAVLASSTGATAAALLAGLVTFEGGQTEAAAESSGATVAVAPSGGATGPGQPLVKSLSDSLSGDFTDQQPGEEDSLQPFQSTLKVIKRGLSTFSGVMDALGRKSAAAVLQQFHEMLEKLGRPANPSVNDNELQNREVKDANLAPGQTPVRVLGGSAADPEGVDIILWDRGIDVLFQDPRAVGSDRTQPGAGVFGAVALVASRLVGTELYRRRPARSSWTRKPRPRSTGATPRDRKLPRSTP